MLQRSFCFTKDISMDDIHVTEMVYPAVAGQIKRTPSTASRRVERLANLCWDTLWKEDWLSNTLRASEGKSAPPRDMIFYLAYYLHFGHPFYKVIAAEPALLF